MYKESVKWYFERLQREWLRAKPSGTLELESTSKNPGKRYKIVDDKGHSISPPMKSKHIKIWMDAYQQGLEEARR